MWTRDTLDILFIKKRVKLTARATTTINDNRGTLSFLEGFDIGLWAGHYFFLGGYACCRQVSEHNNI